jgi:hypothetical protein
MRENRLQAPWRKKYKAVMRELPEYVKNMTFGTICVSLESI